MDESAQDPASTDVLSFFRTYKIPIILGSVSLLCIVVALVLLVKSTQGVTPIQFSQDSTLGTESANFKAITVDVEGAVLRPGVISLPLGSRVEDSIIAAGGLTKNADENYVAQKINRAMKVADGMKIYVPTTDETSHNIGTDVATPGISSQNGAYVSVNLASKDQLDSLPGVGPVTAQKIIDNRPYASLDDLVAKKAIGPSLFEKLKNTLSL
jgi:competence protein ComEA